MRQEIEFQIMDRMQNTVAEMLEAAELNLFFLNTEYEESMLRAVADFCDRIERIKKERELRR